MGSPPARRHFYLNCSAVMFYIGTLKLQFLYDWTKAGVHGEAEGCWFKPRRKGTGHLQSNAAVLLSKLAKPGMLS